MSLSNASRLSREWPPSTAIKLAILPRLKASHMSGSKRSLGKGKETENGRKKGREEEIEKDTEKERKERKRENETKEGGKKEKE